MKKFLIFIFLSKIFYSLDIKSSIKMSKDITDEREACVKINFVDLRHTLIEDVLKIRTHISKIEPYNHGLLFELGLPLKIEPVKNLFLGIKGANNDYFLKISKNEIKSDFKFYLKNLFRNYDNNKKIKYGFINSISFDENKINFEFIKFFLKYLYKNSYYNLKYETKLGIKEYFESVAPLKFTLDPKKIESMTKIKKQCKTKKFLKIIFNNKYKIFENLYIGSVEKIYYSIDSNRPISKISLKASIFIDLKYMVAKNLFINHKVSYLYTHNFITINNNLHSLFETTISYKL